MSIYTSNASQISLDCPLEIYTDLQQEISSGSTSSVWYPSSAPFCNIRDSQQQPYCEALDDGSLSTLSTFEFSKAVWPSKGRMASSQTDTSFTKSWSMSTNGIDNEDLGDDDMFTALFDKDLDWLYNGDDLLLSHFSGSEVGVNCQENDKLKSNFLTMSSSSLDMIPEISDSTFLETSPLDSSSQQQISNIAQELEQAIFKDGVSSPKDEEQQLPVSLQPTNSSSSIVLSKERSTLNIWDKDFPIVNSVRDVTNTNSSTFCQEKSPKHCVTSPVFDTAEIATNNKHSNTQEEHLTTDYRCSRRRKASDSMSDRNGDLHSKRPKIIGAKSITSIGNYSDNHGADNNETNHDTGGSVTCNCYNSKKLDENQENNDNNLPAQKDRPEINDTTIRDYQNERNSHDFNFAKVGTREEAHAKLHRATHQQPSRMSSSNYQEHHRNGINDMQNPLYISPDESAVVTNLRKAMLCVVCQDKAKQDKDYCKSCYGMVYKHARTMVAKELRRGINFSIFSSPQGIASHLLNLTNDTKFKGCRCQGKCPRSAYHKNVLKKCTKCRLLACFRLLPDLADRLMKGAIAADLRHVQEVTEHSKFVQSDHTVQSHEERSIHSNSMTKFLQERQTVFGDQHFDTTAQLLANQAAKPAPEGNMTGCNVKLTKSVSQNPLKRSVYATSPITAGGDQRQHTPISDYIARNNIGGTSHTMSSMLPGSPIYTTGDFGSPPRKRQVLLTDDLETTEMFTNMNSPDMTTFWKSTCYSTANSLCQNNVPAETRSTDPSSASRVVDSDGVDSQLLLRQ